jgi:hypothetical protein
MHIHQNPLVLLDDSFHSKMHRMGNLNNIVLDISVPLVIKWLQNSVSHAELRLPS